MENQVWLTQAWQLRSFAPTQDLKVCFVQPSRTKWHGNKNVYWDDARFLPLYCVSRLWGLIMRMEQVWITALHDMPQRRGERERVRLAALLITCWTLEPFTRLSTRRLTFLIFRLVSPLMIREMSNTHENISTTNGWKQQDPKNITCILLHVLGLKRD